MKIITQNPTNMILRLDKGEELMSELRLFASKQEITAAHFTAIGACSRLILSFYNLETKEYQDKKFTEDLEVTGVIGNIAILGGEIAVHAHGTFGDNNFQTRAGHVKELVVSATAEVFITLLSGPITRVSDETTGLNLLQ